MYKSKPCVGLVFDRSFLIYDVLKPMGIIFTILNHNQDAYIVYGGIERLTAHVEEYAENLKIPKEQLIPLCIPSCCKPTKFLTNEANSKWFKTLLSYTPDAINIFRDSGHFNETSTLCAYAVKLHIPVIEFDNRGQHRLIGTEVPDNINYGYSGNKGGRAPY